MKILHPLLIITIRPSNDSFCTIYSLEFSLIHFYGEKYEVSIIFIYVGIFSHSGVFEMLKMSDGTRHIIEKSDCCPQKLSYDMCFVCASTGHNLIFCNVSSWMRSYNPDSFIQPEGQSPPPNTLSNNPRDKSMI